MTLNSCPNCGQTVCSDCGQHHGQVGAASTANVAKQQQQQFQVATMWSDPSPYPTPGLHGVSIPPTWLDYARYAFWQRVPEDFLKSLDGVPKTWSLQKRSGYVSDMLGFWITHRWNTATAWQRELGWSDAPGNQMWLMFQLWWYGWDAKSREKHYIKCAGPNSYWDPGNLSCHIMP